MMPDPTAQFALTIRTTRIDALDVSDVVAILSTCTAALEVWVTGETGLVGENTPTGNNVSIEVGV
jgi:hypothetical protein